MLSAHAAGPAVRTSNNTADSSTIRRPIFPPHTAERARPNGDHAPPAMKPQLFVAWKMHESGHDPRNADLPATFTRRPHVEGWWGQSGSLVHQQLTPAPRCRHGSADACRNVV